MTITQILFWILSVAALFSALMVITSKNPVHSVLWLIATFFAISGHYILLNAQFLAIVNIIVYAGAIMVLFLFVLMLMNLNRETEPQKNRWVKTAGAIAGGCLLLILVAALKNVETTSKIEDFKGGNIGLVKSLGKELFSTYVVPFEISSILFLSAMVGAVVIGKKNDMIITATHYIVLSLALFSIGIVGVLTRRNAIIIFMCIELMLNAVNLVLVAFPKMHNYAAKEALIAANLNPVTTAGTDGQLFVFFIMVVAAAEGGVGLAIIVMMYRNIHSVDVNFLNRLKH